MRNAFLIARSVIFALLTYFSLLVLIFAIWNVHATSDIEQSVPGSAILLIFNSCVLFVLLALSFAQFAIPRVKVAIVAFEICWVLVLSMFEVGASISLVVNGPVLTCQLSHDWDICASSYLLIPTVWMKSFILLGYLFLLIVTTFSHSREIPTVWCSSIYSISWFALNFDVVAPPGQPGVKALLDPEDDSWTRYLANIACSSDQERKQSADSFTPMVARVDIEKAPWANDAGIRRGIDDPFTRRDDGSSTATSRIPLPVRPARTESTKAPSVGSRFIERFRESQFLSRQGGSHFSMDSAVSGSASFPKDVLDHDKPIPLPRLSQWLRADAMKGLNVHSKVPYSP